MRKTSIRILSAILAVTMLVGLVPMMTISSSAAFNDTSLKFDENGDFTVIQIADIQDDTEVHETTLALISKAMQKYQPDLVVFTGDNVESGMDESEFKTSVAQFMAPVIAAGARYAVTFGNHDAEDKNIVNTAWDKQSQYDHFISMSDLAIDFDENSLSGVGTGSIPIYSNDGSRVAFCVFPIDSGMYDENDDYDYVKDDQIAWYASESARLATLNNGNAVPTLIFQHIPVPEIYSNLLVECSSTDEGAVSGQTPNYSGKYYKLDPDNSTITGVLGEGPCPPTQNNGQYQGWLDVGNVVGAFFGHDHKNYFVGTDANGITMGYTKAATLEAYHSDDNDPGVRVFNIKEDGSYTTDHVTYNSMLMEDADYERDEIAGTPTVPEVLYVGASDNSLAKQEHGTTIQTHSLNHMTQALYPNDLTVTIDLANTVTDVSLTPDTGISISEATVTAKDDTTNTYTWTITGGTASAGTAAEFKVTYTHEGVTLYQYAYSAVENIKSPAGHYVFSRNYRGNNNSDNFNTQRYLMTVLGDTVFGNARSTTDVDLLDTYENDGTTVGSWTNAPAGYYNYTLSDDDGFVQMDISYGINYMSPARVRVHNTFPRFTQAGYSPVATAYLDSSEFKNLTGAGIAVNYWRHQAPDNGITTTFTIAVKEGDVGYTTSDWNTGVVDSSLVGTQNASVTLLNARGSNVTNYLTGEMPEDGDTYTLISQGYSYWDENYETHHYTWTPVLLKFVVYDKSDLRSLLNAERTTMRQLEDNITYRAAFKEAFRQVQKTDTTQADIDAALFRLESAINALSFTGSDVSNNAEYYADSTVPTRLYVAGSGYGLSAQPKGTTIQPTIINYQTRAMIDYTTFGITLPNGATNATVTVVNQTTGVDITSNTTWDEATATGKFTGGTANPGDTIVYRFKYEIAGTQYEQIEASTVADAPQASGWLTFIRRERQWAWDDYTSQKTTFFWAPVGVPTAGFQYEATQGNGGYDNAYYGVNLTNFSDVGSQQVSGFGINSWTGPSRDSTDSWYCGADGGDDDSGVYRAKFDMYFDSSVVSDFDAGNMMLTLIDLGAGDDNAHDIQLLEEGYYLGTASRGNGYGTDVGNINTAAYDESGTEMSTPTVTQTVGDYFYKFMTLSGLPANGTYTYAAKLWSDGDRDINLYYGWHINVVATDKTDLHNLIAQEDEYFRQLADGYSDANGKWTAYQEALAAAKAAAQDASLTAAENQAQVTALQKAIDELEYVLADYTELNAKIAEICQIYYTDETNKTGRYYYYRPNIDVDPLYYAREEYYSVDYFNVSVNEMNIPLDEILDHKMNLDIRYQAEVDSLVDVLDIGWQSAQLRAADYTTVDMYLGYKTGTNPNGSTGGLSIVLPDIEKYSMFADLENRDVAWDNYTTDTYNTWANACAPAMSNRSLKSPDQPTVDGYAAALETAYNALELKLADYTELEAMITEATSNIDTTVEVVDPSNSANNYDITYYDPDYIAQLRAKTEEKVDGLYILQQEDVDVLTAEIDALYVALGNHLNDADFTYANEQKAITVTYEATPLVYYTESSWNRLVAARSAVTEAESYGYMTGEQVTVNALAQEVYDARNALTYNEADYSEVNSWLAKIQEIEPNKDDYVDWSGIEAAVANVQTGLDITYQAAVDSMADELEAAYNALKLKDADYTGLNDKITEAKNAISNQALYTPGSFANFLAVYNTALEFYMAEPKVDIQHQSEVDAQTTALAAAIEALEYVDATIAPLEEAIGYYYSVDYYAYEAEYPTDTDDDGIIDVYEDVEAAFQAADAIMTRYNNDELDIRNNAEIQAAADALNAALNNLPALYANVDYEIEMIPAEYYSTPEMYTDDSRKALDDALAAVDRTLKIGDQEKVEEMAVAIYEAVEGLTEADADLTALKNAIAAADEKIAGQDTSSYTDASWAVFESAYNAAVDIRDADPALLYSEQAEVDAATNALIQATTDLTKKSADYDALNAAIAKANGLTASDWTDETWAEVVSALAAANNVDKNLTIDDQATVTAAADALNAAIDKLESAEVPLVLKAKEGSTTVIDKDRGFIYGLSCAGVDAYAENEYVEDLVAQNFVEIEGDGRLEYTYVGNYSVLGTGAKVEFINNKTDEVVETYYIVIFGDINGDGTVSLNDSADAIDYMQWNDSKHYYDDFTDPAVFAADVDGNGEVTLVDFAICNDYLAWNTEYIPQTR